MTELTARRAREVFDYNPKTGIIIWKVRIGRRVRVGKEAGGWNSMGYRKIRVDKKLYLAHRIAWLISHGSWPEHQIDHINHIKSDNRLANLRVVTGLENRRNSTRNKNNTSGRTGIDWHKGRWRAQITLLGKVTYIGRFVEFDDAVAVREQAEREHGFHVNHGKENGV